MESLLSMPFVKKDEERQVLSSSNPLFDGLLHYQQLEKGSWIIYSEIKSKLNACFELDCDEEKVHSYYCLSLNILEPKPIVYKELNDKPITFPKYSWSLQTPSEDSAIQYMNLHSTGTTKRHLSFYFDREWFQNNLEKSSFFMQSELGEFIRTGKGFLFSPLEDAEYVSAQFQVFRALLGVDTKDVSRNNLFNLKVRSLNL